MQTTPRFCLVLVPALLLGAMFIATLSRATHAHADAYELRRVGRDYRGDNQAQALSVTLRKGAASVTASRAGDRTVEAQLELTGFGRVGRVRPVALRGVSRHKDRIEHNRGSVREWFVNGPLGLQQGFDVARRPAGAGPLVLQITFRGVIPKLRSDSRVALLLEGQERLSYDTLRAWDASGKDLPARMRVAHGRVELWVDDQGARYPIVVDPYVQQAIFTPANPVRFNLYGSALAGKENTLLIGARGDTTHGPYAGAVHVLGWNGTEWVETEKLFPGDPREQSQFGSSIGLSGDSLVVGAFADASETEGAGSAYVFVWDGTEWTQQAKLRAPSPEARAGFGAAVAIAGDVIVVGESGRSGAAAATGRAYIFTRPGDTWIETAQLSPRNSNLNTLFGHSVDVSGDTLIVGAPGEREQGRTTGVAYIFRRAANGTWAQEARLTPLPVQADREFGVAVAIEGDRAIVGAAGDSDAAGKTGAVYVYERQGTTWRQRARVTASDARADGYFGKAVDLAGDLLAIGSDHTSPSGLATGAAYVFARTSSIWTEQAKLVAPEPTLRDGMGNEVLVLGRTVFVSATHRNQPGLAFTGAVHAFFDRPLELGDACRYGVECPTGYCEDGVCCNEACGGSASDCRACSAELTGQPSGTCSQLAEGAACGSAVDTACDGADTCDARGVCLNNRAADDTTCEAGGFCTVGDLCRAGLCVEGRRNRCLASEKCDETADLCYLACGDGTLDPTEECDLGTENSDAIPNRCRTNCSKPFCGDGVKDSTEECDLAAANSDTAPNGCRPSCRRSYCGDGVLDSGEGCDDGAANGEGDAPTCREGCVPARCGDGIRDPEEACDDGPLNSRTVPNACRPSCVTAYCGDGVVDDGEACDLGRSNADDVPDRCRTTCRAPTCGDGVLDTGEACEPMRDGARCNLACAWIEPEPEPVADAATPMQQADAGTPSAMEHDAGSPPDGGDDDTKISAGGCAVTQVTHASWFWLPLGGLALFRTSRRARRRCADGVSAA